MTTGIIEVGTISARGQIAIPSDIRRSMELKEGSKVLFVLEDDSLLIKRITSRTFEQVTRPLREAVKKSRLKESEIPDIVHKVRAKRRK